MEVGTAITNTRFLFAWETYEGTLLFVAMVLSIMIVLVLWGFRTAQASWAVRLIYQFSVAIFIVRAYLLRVVEVDRGWVTNATIIIVIIGEVALLSAIVSESGLLGARKIPPGSVK